MFSRKDYIFYDELSRMKKEGFSERDLSRFGKKYSWLPCLDVFNAPWSIAEIRIAVQSVKPEKSGEKNEPLRRLLARLSLNASEAFQLTSANELVFIKDQRDVYRRRGVFLSQPFYKKVAALSGQTLSDVAYWTHDELLDWSKNAVPVSLTVIGERKRGYLLLKKNARYVCLCGSEARKTLSGLKFNSGGKKTELILKGIVGSRGFTQGIAKIVRTVSDLEKVKTGDVMVAITTHPDFVPAMHRACAIVTDEGGLTSHAAIVSREFNIPCIVGTKTATRTFEDGDFVLVDAKKGVVKKLPRQRMSFSPKHTNKY